jgi:hypothetical protein
MVFEDAETREAAETLSGLRNIGKRHQPTQYSTLPARPATLSDKALSTSTELGAAAAHAPATATAADDDRLPLLTLITHQHPWIGGTISGSLTAYNTTLSYSPAFIRNSATFIERNLANPVASGLETMSRRTGVDSRVRRYLGDRPGSVSDEEEAPARKRRRPRSPDAAADALERGYVTSPTAEARRSRAPSQTSCVESLPAYDDNHSPAYEEKAPTGVLPMTFQGKEQQQEAGPQRQQMLLQRPDHRWHTQVIMTTSGLGVALSETSLRSLRHCLVLLKQAFEHLATVIAALRKILEDLEALYSGQSSSSERDAEKGDHSSSSSAWELTPAQEATSREIADRVKALGSDIVKTLQSVTRFVSQYTGSALPANAGALVRRQLLSVPQRYRIAHGDDETPAGSSANGSSSAQSAASDVASLGQKWLKFGQQGCEMIEQVTMVVSGTVDSAESWLGTMGRKKADQDSAEEGSSSGSAIEEADHNKVTIAYLPLNEEKRMPDEYPR